MLIQNPPFRRTGSTADSAESATVTLASDRPFYEVRNNEGIYKFFREEYSVYGSIFKPTGVGKNEDYITLSGRYDFIWQDLSEGRKYYIIEI